MHPQVLPRFKMKTARTLLELIHVSGEFLCLHAGHICDQNHYVIELSVPLFRMPISQKCLEGFFSNKSPMFAWNQGRTDWNLVDKV